MWATSRRLLSTGFLLVLALMGLTVSAVHGQEGRGWSEPQLLLTAPANDNGTIPIVYTGPSNNTHLLYFGRPADDPDGPFALYYARWVDGAWTPPIDVLVSPDGALPSYLAAVEDSQGYLHVFWSTNAIWRARVALAEATNPQSWNTPEIVYGDRPTLEIAAAIDPDDDIHLAVSTRSSTVEYISAPSDGSSGEPVLIHEISGSDFWPYHISLVTTAHGKLLACWAETDGTGTARGVWCSSSEDKGRSWGAPEMIASGHRGARLFDFPATGQVGRIIWGGLGTGGRELQLSEDEGRTWSPPVDLTQGISMAGYTGQVAAMDSAGNIHVLINPGDGKYVHVRTQNGNWLPHIQTGWQASDWIEMAVAEGNTLVVVYWMAGNTYTSHMILSAPRLAPAALTLPDDTPTQAETTSAAPTAKVDVDSMATPAVTPVAQFSTAGQGGSGNSSQAQGVLVGVSSAAVVVLGVIIFQLRRRRR